MKLINESLILSEIIEEILKNVFMDKVDVNKELFSNKITLIDKQDSKKYFITINYEGDL